MPLGLFFMLLQDNLALTIAPPVGQMLKGKVIY